MNGSVVARDALMASLQREVEKLEGGRQPGDERRVSTGVAVLDRLLPGGGLARGTLVEYLSGSAGGIAGGGGAATLSLAAAREACGRGQALVVVERKDGTQSVPTAKLYPPAAAAWGIDLAAMLVLRTTSEADALWAFDQALRCPGVGAVWGAWERLDVCDFRRLQLAAERGGTIGLLVRSAKWRGQPTWAEVKWEVCPFPLRVGTGMVFSRGRHVWQQRDHRRWQLEIELVRCRGAVGGQKVVLELDEVSGMWREGNHEPAHTVSVFAELADSTARRA